MTSRSITCREFIDFLMAYLDGELPPQERAVFDAHLEVCEACVAYLHSYEETVRLGKLSREDPDAPVPPDVPEDLVAAILAARPRKG